MRNTPPEEHVPVGEEADLDLIAECLHPRRGGDQDEPAGTVVARAKTAIVAAERKWPGSIGGHDGGGLSLLNVCQLILLKDNLHVLVDQDGLFPSDTLEFVSPSMQLSPQLTSPARSRLLDHPTLLHCLQM